MKRGLHFILIYIFSITRLIGQGDDLRTEIEKIIRFDTDIDFKKTPGFIINIIDNDSNYHYVFGTKEVGKKIDLTSDDIFEVGSVSKVFTSRLIEMLIAEKLLNSQDLVNSFLPEYYQNPRLNDITIFDLVSHQSGLPKRPAFFGKKEKDGRNPYEFYSKNDLLKFYRDFIPKSKSFEYSHVNYALLEIIIENTVGKSFQDVMDEKIFIPLDMKKSFIDFPEKKENLIAPGYDRSKKLSNTWSFQSFKASEGVKTTINDLNKFFKSELNNNFDKSSADGFNDKLGMKMGWHTIKMDDFDIFIHTGKTTGHSAYVSMVRETKTAVIILSNSSAGTEDLGLQLLRMINYNWKRIKV